MASFAVTAVSSLLRQASTCFRIGSKLRCIRSTPTEMQSTSENDFECFANTGVNTPETMFSTVGLPTRSVKFFGDETRQLDARVGVMDRVRRSPASFERFLSPRSNA